MGRPQSQLLAYPQMIFFQRLEVRRTISRTANEGGPKSTTAYNMVFAISASKTSHSSSCDTAFIITLSRLRRLIHLSDAISDSYHASAVSCCQHGRSPTVTSHQQHSICVGFLLHIPLIPLTFSIFFN